MALETPEAMANESSNHSVSGKSANDYFKDGEKKFRLNDYQGAVDSYSKAIDINPNNAIAYNNRGNAKDELGDYQSALNDHNKLPRGN